MFVNGNQLPLNEFVSKMIGKTVLGMVSSLKHVEKPLKVLVELKVSEEDYLLF